MNFAGYNIPEHTQHALSNYIEHGFEPGGFLCAVLSNDLMGAVARADSMNAVAIPEIAKFIYNQVPRGAWGSAERISEYCASVAAHRNMLD